MKKIITLAIAVLMSMSVYADKAGVKVATLTAGGDAKEVSVDQQISKVLIKCIDGNVIINTVAVRDGGNVTKHSVGAKINKGEVQQITVGEKVNCSGLRISDDGRGQYEVRVKK
jgi:hypothetical protein